MMLGLMLGAVLAAAPLTPEGLELEAARYVREQSARGARDLPGVDALLTRAARRLARQALATPEAQAPDTLTATEAAGEEGGAELITATAAVRSGVPSHVLELLREKQGLGTAAPLLGVGVAAGDGQVALVVLKGERRVKLEPFPRALNGPGKGGILCGALLQDLGVPAVHLTRPDGTVERVRLARHEQRSFCAGLDFPQEGLHTVTLSAGKSPGVNMVGAFRVRVGQAGAAAEPSAREDALGALVRRINALRQAERLASVKRDAVLERVAQAYADRMAREGFHGPEAPDGTTLRERITDNGSARLHWSQNLGWGAGPLAAHFGIEHGAEPRRNLLDPLARHVGLGLAWRQGGNGRREAIVVELLSRGAPMTPFASSPTEEAYRTLARLRPPALPALQRSPVLEAQAVELARSPLQPGEVTEVAVHERILKALPLATAASGVVYEVEDVLSLPRPAVLKDAATSALGVAVVDTGATPAYRVIVLTASQPRPNPKAEEVMRNAPDKMMGGRAKRP